MQHRAGTNPLPSHLKDRLTFINVESDLDTFLEYANGKGLDHRLLGFLRNRPDFLSKFDPAVDSCPSPRSWMRVDTMLKMELPKSLERKAVLGQVGQGAQADLLAYLKVADEMPDPKAILAGTHKAVPESPDVLYACLLYTSPSPRDRQKSRMPSSA